MTASERDALVARVRVCADELYGLPGEGQLLRLSPRNAEWIAVDLRALCAEVERLTRERDALIADLDDASREITDLTDENALMREDVTRLPPRWSGCARTRRAQGVVDETQVYAQRWPDSSSTGNRMLGMGWHCECGRVRNGHD